MNKSGHSDGMLEVAGHTEEDIRRCLRRGDLERLHKILRDVRAELGAHPTIPPWPWEGWKSYNEALGDPLHDCRHQLAELERELDCDPGELQMEAEINVMRAKSEERLREESRVEMSEHEFHWEFKNARLKTESHREPDRK